ncbi:hypothetical protein T4B_12463 [Trichinella pseudospiralis]|uniref:Uncharacterized protein n=1 Tax=Trichinella pseudospiralis TaxID=6337 RepID=A0A0V1J3N4_TRIPS|nr:hypothetical protein T4A_8743 [Trichinella pseudospiralis]KRZ19507.1 hypothetical protein T4B_12463 [Trichinella pseudospiralis]KRZ29606.1 hypothetical protein T4C_13223 [Trichinella pseudospiralis]
MQYANFTPCIHCPTTGQFGKAHENYNRVIKVWPCKEKQMRAQAKKEEKSKSSCFFNKNFKLRSIKTLLFLLFPHFPKCWSNEEEEQEDELIRDARCGAQKIDTAYSWTKSITSHIASHSPAGSLSLFSVRLGKAMEAEQKKNKKKKNTRSSIKRHCVWKSTVEKHQCKSEDKQTNILSAQFWDQRNINQ